jgi:hypothetical protein
LANTAITIFRVNVCGRVMKQLTLEVEQEVNNMIGQADEWDMQSWEHLCGSGKEVMEKAESNHAVWGRW